MAAKLHTCFLSHGLIGLNTKNSNICSADFSLHHHHRLFPPASCRIRQRKISSQQKKRQVKKVSPKKLQLDTKLQPNGQEDVDFANDSIDFVSSSNESTPEDDVENSVVSKQVNEDNSGDLPMLDNNMLMLPPPRPNDSFVTRLDSRSTSSNDSLNPKSLDAWRSGLGFRCIDIINFNTCCTKLLLSSGKHFGAQNAT